jgi:polyisoprenoid-binding protein YceI
LKDFEMEPQMRMANGKQTVWAIDPTHSTVELTVKKLFLFTVKGSIAIAEGKLVVDANEPRPSSVTAVLKAASINTNNQRRDAHLRTSGFLDVERYPTILFASTKVEPGLDRDTLRVTGSLTIRDQTREIVLDVSDIDRSRSPGGEQIAYYTALTELDRHSFGIKHPGLIGRALKITINIQATRRT